MSQKTIVIVDAISGGRYFPKIAAEYFGLECVHILSSGTLPGVIVSSYNAKDFVRSFVWSDRDRDSILEYLRELNLVGVIAGSEVGVELADLLSETLNLPGNGTGNSRARRSKILMHKLVSESKVRVPKQISTDNLTDMLSFVDEHLTFPLVVKPDESAGSDGFYLANNWTEASQAFYNIYRKTNQLGQKNTSVLIQEFIQGDEFAVNTVSAHGVHVITHIWKYHKKTIGPNRVYDWEEYIDLDSQIGLEISHFAKKVITALGIKFGAAHTEIMLDGGGFVLIESASRVDGMCNPGVDNFCLGINQVHLSILSYIDPSSVFTFFEKNYKKNGFLLNVSLIAGDSPLGTIRSINGNLLKKLSSFRDVRWSVNVGSMLSPTIDIFSSPGFVYLFGQTKDSVFDDYKKIRSFEKFLFELKVE